MDGLKLQRIPHQCRYWARRPGVALFVVMMLLAGCGTTGVKAPVGRAPEAGATAQTTRSTVRKTSRATAKSVTSTRVNPANLHVVRGGETLYAIAWRYGVDFRALGDWNGIDAPYVIYPGQKLRLKPRPETRSKVVKPAQKTTREAPRKVVKQTRRKPTAAKRATPGDGI